MDKGTPCVRGGGVWSSVLVLISYCLLTSGIRFDKVHVNMYSNRYKFVSVLKRIISTLWVAFINEKVCGMKQSIDVYRILQYYKCLNNVCKSALRIGDTRC